MTSVDPTLSRSPFAKLHRVQLIDRFFGRRTIDPAEAWKDVYRLLLWVDERTRIAHCYESDKSQPGRAWYARSLAFHEWVSDQFGVAPSDLHEHVDWMFQQVMTDVIESEMDATMNRARRGQAGVAPDALKRLPMSWEDPYLHELVEPLMPLDPVERLSPAGVSRVLRKLAVYMRSGVKRANLLGRGFEDALDGLIRRLPSQPAHHGAQTPLEDVPGFSAGRDGDTVSKVDLWVGDGAQRRILVSAKWSVRADRERQLWEDLQAYEGANEWQHPFEYVLVTNEFDPARLVGIATKTLRPRIDRVVHVCPEALAVVHELNSAKLTRSSSRLRELLQAKRIVGLDAFLLDVCGTGAPT